MNADDLQSI